MAGVSTQACEAFKGALAAESGRIQALIQHKLKEYKGFALNVVPETDYDMSMGVNPLSVRYRGARVKQEDYQFFLASGSETRSFESENCAGGVDTLSASANKNSNCETVGTKVHMGYEEFTRYPKRTAIESEIICILSVIEKKAPGEYIRALRKVLVDSAIERYDRSVLGDMVRLAYHKTSVTQIYHQNSGSVYFPAIPEGVLSIGTLKRIADRMDQWGYSDGARGPMMDGQPVITCYCSRTAMEQAIENHLKSRGVQRTMEYTRIADPKFGETVFYEGIQFIVDKRPTRGWLNQTPSGQYEFVEVLPTVNAVASGEGIHEIPNEDYLNCYTTCNGYKQKLYEIAYLPHPEAMERQRFSIPAVHEMFSKMGAKYASFDVMYLNDKTLWDGCGPDGNPVIIKNEDQLKAKMKIVHAYAPFSLYPEKMGVVLYEASPDPIEVYPSTCIDECDDNTDLKSIGLDEHPAMDNCGTCSTTLRPDDRDPLYEDRSGADPYPSNGAGEIRMVSCALTAGGAETSIKIGVERVGGDQGAAGCQLDTADGTATAGVDYTAVAAEAINWADGVSGIQYVTITLTGNTPANAGKAFTATISGPTGVGVLTVTDCTVTTITFEDPSDCESDPAPCGC